MNYPGDQFDAITAAAVSPDQYQNPKPQGRYHLVVIGAGPAGLITAISAAGLGGEGGSCRTTPDGRGLFERGMHPQ